MKFIEIVAADTHHLEADREEPPPYKDKVFEEAREKVQQDERFCYDDKASTSHQQENQHVLPATMMAMAKAAVKRFPWLSKPQARGLAW